MNTSLPGTMLAMERMSLPLQLVASIAAGVLVPNVNFHGLASGYARGGAPHARLAIYKGQSLFYESKDKDSWFELYPVVNVRCDESSLTSTHVVGRIVFCYGPNLVKTNLPFNDLPLAVSAAKKAAARGLIFAMYTLDDLGSVKGCDTMACVLVDFEVADGINNYIDTAKAENSTSVAKVAPANTWIGSEVHAPRISAFSSRGPSPLFPEFLKPDVAAPGSNILAALRNSYLTGSGTSMSCPHVSASTHSYGLPILADGKPQKIADPFDYGGGFIDPNKAIDPGLAYDVDPKDYMKGFSCNFEISDIGCEPPYNLNLPSIAIPNLKTFVSVWRTVTNVGKADAVYKVFFPVTSWSRDVSGAVASVLQ